MRARHSASSNTASQGGGQFRRGARRHSLPGLRSLPWLGGNARTLEIILTRYRSPTRGTAGRSQVDQAGPATRHEAPAVARDRTWVQRRPHAAPGAVLRRGRPRARMLADRARASRPHLCRAAGRSHRGRMGHRATRRGRYGTRYELEAVRSADYMGDCQCRRLPGRRPDAPHRLLCAHRLATTICASCSRVAA